MELAELEIPLLRPMLVFGGRPHREPVGFDLDLDILRRDARHGKACTKGIVRFCELRAGAPQELPFGLEPIGEIVAKQPSSTLEELEGPLGKPSLNLCQLIEQ